MNEKWFHIILDAIYLASDKIMEVYEKDFHVHRKEDRSPVTLADTESNFILTEALKATGIMVVSEEEEKPKYAKRKNEKYIWLVDPLDGTNEFINKNQEFCICIALIEDGKPIFGLIANPIDRDIIYGGKKFGAFYCNYSEREFLSPANKIKLKAMGAEITMVYSRSHFSPRVGEIINELEDNYEKVHVLKKGSALKFFDLVLGRADYYPRMAPTMEWDIAAGHAIYEAIGGEVIDFTNFEPLQYNKQSLFNPHFIARRKGIEIPKDKDYE